MNGFNQISSFIYPDLGQVIFLDRRLQKTKLYAIVQLLD